MSAFAPTSQTSDTQQLSSVPAAQNLGCLVWPALSGTTADILGPSAVVCEALGRVARLRDGVSPPGHPASTPVEGSPRGRGSCGWISRCR